MNTETSLSELMDGFQRQGLYGFDRAQVEKSLPAGFSQPALTKGLQRLAKRNRVRRLRKGFHVILPVEYSLKGMIPYDWFLDDLMRSLQTPYYVGLQSAAALYGASHQQIQQLQVIIPRQERPLEVPGLSIRFFRKLDFASTPLEQHKGHAGLLPVSSPEATALDLVRYANQVGGLDAVLTVLAELTEAVKPEKLASLGSSETGESAPLQRLGWLLDKLGQSDLADALHSSLTARSPLPRTRLDPAGSWSSPATTNRWRVLENADPQSDL